MFTTTFARRHLGMALALLVAALIATPSIRAQEVKKPLELAGHDRKAVTAIALPAKSGPFIATAGKDGTIRLWGAESGKLETEIKDEGQKGFVGALAFSPDAKILAAGDDQGLITLWDVAKAKEKNAEPLARLNEHTAVVRCLAFDNDGKMLASAGEDDRVIIWDVAKGNSAVTIKIARETQDPEDNRNDYVLAACDEVSFSPDGSKLAVQVRRTCKAHEWFSNTLMIYDTAEGKLRSILKLPFTDPGYSVGQHGFTPESELFFLGHGEASGLIRADWANSFLTWTFTKRDEIRDKPAVKLLVSPLVSFNKQKGAGPYSAYFPRLQLLAAVAVTDDKEKDQYWQVTFQKLKNGRFEQVAVAPKQESAAERGPNFFFSPDCSRLAIITVRNRVEVWDLRPFVKE
jgi:hypothetical protein